MSVEEVVLKGTGATVTFSPFNKFSTLKLTLRESIGDVWATGEMHVKGTAIYPAVEEGDMVIVTFSSGLKVSMAVFAKTSPDQQTQTDAGDVELYLINAAFFEDLRQARAAVYNSLTALPLQKIRGEVSLDDLYKRVFIYRPPMPTGTFLDQVLSRQVAFQQPFVYIYDDFRWGHTCLNLKSLSRARPSVRLFMDTGFSRLPEETTDFLFFRVDRDSGSLEDFRARKQFRTLTGEGTPGALGVELSSVHEAALVRAKKAFWARRALLSQRTTFYLSPSSNTEALSIGDVFVAPVADPGRSYIVCGRELRLSRNDRGFVSAVVDAISIPLIEGAEEDM